MSDLLSIMVWSTVDYILVILLQLKSILVKAPARWKNGTKGNIILIPGFMCSWTFFQYLGTNLNLLDYRIHVIEKFEHTAMSMEKYCEVLNKYLTKNKLTNVIFLCHSRGGKVSKYFSAIYPKNKPLKAIHIASKYNGAFWARLKIFNLDEFDSNSKVLKIINADPDNKHILNLYPAYDNMFFSTVTNELPNAINIRINVVGHTRILFSEETLSRIKSFLMQD